MMIREESKHQYPQVTQFSDLIVLSREWWTAAALGIGAAFVLPMSFGSAMALRQRRADRETAPRAEAIETVVGDAFAEPAR